MRLTLPRVNSYLNIIREWPLYLPNVPANKHILAILEKPQLILPFGTGFRVIKIEINQETSIIQLQILSFLEKEKNSITNQLLGQNFEIEPSELSKTAGEWL